MIRSGFIGLFVDDMPHAAAILAWLVVCWAVLPRLALPPVVLFAELGAILAAGALLKARDISP